MESRDLRRQAVALRRKGASFHDITVALGQEIPKSTLSYWLKGVSLTEQVKSERRQRQDVHLRKARLLASEAARNRRTTRLAETRARYLHLLTKLNEPDTAMIALAMLYFGEGSKRTKGSLVFCNANPAIIRLFLRLLRQCFVIDESRLHCTVQGRADQDFAHLQIFWSKVTRVPVARFYKHQIDKRTLGKLTISNSYKGVCRIDYLSADVFTSVVQAIEVFSGP